jgi:hypothetical protein
MKGAAIGIAAPFAARDLINLLKEPAHENAQISRQHSFDSLLRGHARWM